MHDADRADRGVDEIRRAKSRRGGGEVAGERSSVLSVAFFCRAEKRRPRCQWWWSSLDSREIPEAGEGGRERCSRRASSRAFAPTNKVAKSLEPSSRARRLGSDLSSLPSRRLKFCAADHRVSSEVQKNLSLWSKVFAPEKGENTKAYGRG
jgi:hypothetical protein